MGATAQVVKGKVVIFIHDILLLKTFNFLVWNIIEAKTGENYYWMEVTHHKLFFANLLSALEGMIITWHIGHDCSFVRFRCIDQIYFQYSIADESNYRGWIRKKEITHHQDPTCVEYPNISQQHRMLCSSSPKDCPLTIVTCRSNLWKNEIINN